MIRITFVIRFKDFFICPICPPDKTAGRGLNRIGCLGGGSGG
jgi:hypothetical protein